MLIFRNVGGVLRGILSISGPGRVLVGVEASQGPLARGTVPRPLRWRPLEDSQWPPRQSTALHLLPHNLFPISHLPHFHNNHSNDSFNDPFLKMRWAAHPILHHKATLSVLCPIPSSSSPTQGEFLMCWKNLRPILFCFFNSGSDTTA